MPAERIRSIDALRGIVMVIMALDHTRDFFGVPGISPTNLAVAGAPLFLTRWITHICAPTFFLLTGVGASLSRVSADRRQLSRFLLLRGALLVVLELTVIRTLAYQFNIDYRVTFLSVIWALGWAMITLGLLVFLPRWAIGTVGATMVLGHNLFDGVTWSHPLWNILHRLGFALQGDHVVFVAYPLIPWIGVTALGYALGALYTWEPARRRKALLAMGTIAIAAFVVLRALAVYGEPFPWKAQADLGLSVLAFLNTTKYPPSLLFLLMTLGPALLLLRWLEPRIPRPLEPVIVYGRAPFFYFIAHFFLIHALAVVVCLVRYGEAHWMFESPTIGQYPFTPPPDWGYSLPVVYLVWVCVVIALWPACRWMAAAKARRPHSWLSFL